MIPVAFDLRDPVRSGIARVARALAQAFVCRAAGRFQVSIAGPARILEDLGVRSWGAAKPRIIDWDARRYSVRAELGWSRVRREVGDAIWYFPHWDVPWHAHPRRFVMTVHDTGHLVLPGMPVHRRALARFWMRRSARAASAVTTVSAFTRQQLLARWPDLAEKTEFLPNGIDPTFFEAAGDLPREIGGRLAGSPFMLSVGIRKRHKNLAVGVDVLAKLPDLKWVVVGEWFPEWEDVAAYARRSGVLDRMIVVDRESDAGLRALYERAVCLFFPSRYEGFGLPILEALAAGTAVVAANAAGSVETLGGAGAICDPDSPDDFIRAVTDAMKDGASDRERRRERARAFSWDASADQLARIFERVHALA